MSKLLLLFLLIFVLNVIPAFAPPTWMVFSFLGFRFPDHMGVALALVGAFAATLGRFTLAKGSNLIVRRHFLSDEARQNVDAIKEQLSKRKKTHFRSSSLLCLYAAALELSLYRIWTDSDGFEADHHSLFHRQVDELLVLDIHRGERRA